eukprot:scaffold122035_cov30-Tisochrysis_lutea.AAC.2
MGIVAPVPAPCYRYLYSIPLQSCPACYDRLWIVGGMPPLPSPPLSPQRRRERPLATVKIKRYGTRHDASICSWHSRAQQSPAKQAVDETCTGSTAAHGKSPWRHHPAESRCTPFACRLRLRGVVQESL